ncbi:MAG: hypothetical protein J0G28_14430 [Afipia sp.]|nr:hypothetical protein [Afipia sp.]
MSDTYLVSGKLPTDLANSVSDLIHSSISKGMEPDSVVCIVATVAADYARQYYGPKYLEALARLVLMNGGAKQ